MMIPWLDKLKQDLRAMLNRPSDQLTGRQRFVRYSIDLARHARRELRDTSATTMAAALTYRTIFGLVPMIVMGLIVFRAFGGFADSQDGLRNLVYDLLEIEVQVVDTARGEQDDTQITHAPAAGTTNHSPGAATPGSVDGTTPAQAATQPSFFVRRLQQTVEASTPVAGPKNDPELEARLALEQANAEMRQRIDDLVGGLSEGISSISIGSVGVIGMLLLIWAALGLIVTTEKTFNVIYHAPAGRSWHVRIPIYWAIITLGPVLIWGSSYISTQFLAAAHDVPVLGWLVGLVNYFTALLVTWFLFLLLFKFLPNTPVAMRPAMTGALVSALAWELMKAALRWYIDHAVLSPAQTSLYGSLALIPILLFWVYITWMVVLAGLVVSHILQTLPGSRMGEFEKQRPAASARDPWLVIPVMSAIAQAFDQGKTIGVAEIAKQLDAQPMTVAKIVDELVGRGLLHRLNQKEGEDVLALAMPPGKIRISELISTTPANAQAAGLPGHALLMQLAKAQDAALADITLASGSDQ